VYCVTARVNATSVLFLMLELALEKMMNKLARFFQKKNVGTRVSALLQLFQI